MRTVYPRFVTYLLPALALASYAKTQTFEVGSREQKADSRSWGESIQVSREARAAEDALKRGNFAGATMHAKRAAEAAPQNSQLWFTYGYAARLAGHLDESVDAYKTGLERQRGSADGQAGLAQTYLRMGNTPEAKRLLTNVVNSHPDRIQDMLLLGELHMQTGEIQQGINVLQRAETLKPSTHAELLLATGYMKRKEPEKAQQLLDLARRRDPKNVDIFRAMANFQRETKDYDAAIQTLRSAPGRHPDIQADLGYTCELVGRKKESAEAYGRAANLDPQNIQYQLSAGQAEIAAGDSEKGKQYLARAEAIDPNNYRLHAIRAGVAKSENRTEDAIREYNLALAHLPEGVVPDGPLYPVLLRLNLAEIYKSAGQDAQAKEQVALAEHAMSKLNVEGPQRAEFLRVRASIRSGDNNFADAETDLKEAMRLDPNNSNIELQYANLLWRMNRKQDAQNLYEAVLKRETNNRYALESMGYLMRDTGNIQGAEQFFHKLAQAYPEDYVGYFALGDMYTSLNKLDDAETNYELAYKRAPGNVTIVANGANASIEAHRWNVTKKWIDRAIGPMNDDPRMMRERERYLFHVRQYLESANLGYRVLAKLPKDLNGSVYLAYDLYNLGRFDDCLAVASKYEAIIPGEPNFPLLQGHVHKQSQLLNEAFEDYGRAIKTDPKMVEAYVNRGYVLNDLQNSEAALRDFDAALMLNPDNGSALLGSAFSYLQLRKGSAALAKTDEAEKILGESAATHGARAEAYRLSRQFEKAIGEYRAAIRFSPDDVTLQTSLADVLYHAHHYQETVTALEVAAQLSGDDPFLYSQMAHAHAQLKQRDAALKDIAAAEKEGGDQSAVLLATGDALMIMGDKEGANDRFARALDAPDASRVDARLAFAALYARDGKFEDAKQQVSLAFAESRVGEAPPVTADNLVSAATIFLQAHDFALAKRFFQRAAQAGAAEEPVAIGLANTSLAQGNDRDAELRLAGLGSTQNNVQNYDYMLAVGEMYRQRHDTRNALTAFARANALSNEDYRTERSMYETAGEEGYRVREKLTIFSEMSFASVFDDATVYALDEKLDGIVRTKSSTETTLVSGYRYRPDNGFPVISGFLEERNDRGQFSQTSGNQVILRNTFDTVFNSGLNPTLHFRNQRITLNSGLEFTLRRDYQASAELNSNLVRTFLYLDTSSFANWLSIRYSAFYEKGFFTKRTLTSTEKGAKVDFTIGRPWGSNALVTGYAIRDLQFTPLVREFFSTSTYAGWQRKFGQKLTATILGEYIRSWRVSDQLYSIAQAAVPGGSFEYSPNNRWSVNGNFVYQKSEGKSISRFDNIQSSFFISYLMPLHQNVQDGGETVPIGYPIRFQIGIQNQSFTQLSGRGQTITPVFRLTFF